ncbi:hypothetical protein JCM3775_004731 [Rhodotorula graminis]|uniref:Uncharacterized protein n=1 Tax=Rhodotorula graminis (strain WP1) TaxID=578459 RepID=A0A194S8Z6_RHOGW|nr:uncharacterized protein RHOBADRAFT_52011 [Rhodotorula graminis WP1]KPV77049.1 hypothetical protein RHOBADRAFT_52011 [Rhodotorula graminis WP1]
MVSLFALALVALPLAVTASSGAPHYSHPRRNTAAALTAAAAPHARAAVRYRALPRTGRRLSKRGAGGGAGTEATLKCLTAHSFALCDGDRCTDMGAVAAGTMCKDGAITWDTSSEASSEDSSAATVSYAEIPSSSTAAAAAVETPEPSSSSESAEDETLSAAQPLANNVAVKTSSAAEPAATAVDSVQLNVGSSSSDDDDDWECDSDDVSSSSSTAWTPAASSTTTVDDVQLNAKPTTTTTQAPAQTSAASSSSGGGTTYTGRGTYYYQYGTAGSCGNVASDSDYVVALSYTQVDGGAHCGKKVQLTNTDNGKTVTATVADTCPGCAWGAVDLSEGAFLQLGTLDQGVIPLSWKFL